MKAPSKIGLSRSCRAHLLLQKYRKIQAGMLLPKGCALHFAERLERLFDVRDPMSKVVMPSEPWSQTIVYHIHRSPRHSAPLLSLSCGALVYPPQLLGAL